MTSRHPRHSPSDRRPGRRFAAALLRRSGCATPEEVLAELDDAATEVAWPRTWTAWQVVLLCLYEIRDRCSTRTLPGRARRIRPLLTARLAARSVAYRPGIPLLATVTLAVGFGAAAGIFSVYVGFQMPLPVPDGARVVQVRITDPGGETELVDADVRRGWASAEGLAGIGAYRAAPRVLSVPGRGTVRVAGAALEADAFRLLEVAPAIGRLPEAGDLDAVLLSDALWRDLLEGDPAVVGRAVDLDGRAGVVVGVMPPEFGFPFSERLWTLLPGDDREPAPVVARLADGVALDVVAARLQGRLREIRTGAPDAEPARVRVLGFTRERGEGGEAVGLIALLILVMALLVVSATNVANLLLVRAGGRARVLAVHVAMGARPGQVAFQLLAEALLIAFAGALVGLGLAAVGVRYVESTLSGHWGYHWMEVAMRPSVLTFTLGLAFVTAGACGIAPALRLARADLTVALKGESTGPVAGGRPASWLVGMQVAFSSASVVVAALMVAGLLGSSRIDERFPAERVRVVSVALDGPRYAESSTRSALRQALLGQLAGRPEIEAAAVSSGLPGLNTGIGQVETDAGPPPEGTRPPRVAVIAVSPTYPEVMSTRLLAGRRLSAGDGAGDELVGVVSESFVREHLGGEALDRRVRLTGLTWPGLPERWIRVVGVVEDVVVYADRGQDWRDWVYLPVEQVDPGSFYLLYRPRGDAAAALAAVRGAVQEVDPELPLGAAMGSDPGNTISVVLGYIRRLAITIGALGAMGGVAALLVAMVGLYGLLSFEVESRVAEIGVRMALGADRSDVIWQIVRRGLLRVVPGLLIGGAAAWMGAPVFGIVLMGANARSVPVFVATGVLYLLVGVLAGLVPARRAARLDPALSLRAE